MSEWTQAGLLPDDPLPEPVQVGRYTVRHGSNSVNAFNAAGRPVCGVAVTPWRTRDQAHAEVCATLRRWREG